MVKTKGMWIALTLVLPALAMANRQVEVVVSSGGVSLGNYQGGYLLANQEVVKSHADGAKVFTGASAGSINSLAGMYYVFHKGEPYDPFAEWLNIGWSELTRDPNGSINRDRSLFTTWKIEAALDEVISRLLATPTRSERFPVRVGFAMTRFLPPVLNNSLGVRKSDDKIIVGANWLPKCPDEKFPNGCYRFWSEPILGINQGLPQPFLWFGKYGTDTALIRSNLKKLVLASAAFPVAFQPQGLKLYSMEGRAFEAVRCYVGDRCLMDSIPAGLVIRRMRGQPNEALLDTLPELFDEDWGRWAKGPVKYSDGGLFDNQPLALALNVMTNLDVLYPEGKSDLSRIDMILPTNYPVKQPDQKVYRGMIEEWMLYLTSRQPDKSEHELMRGLESKLLNDSMIHVNKTSLPLASEHFQHFSGFFEREFREFDFLMGYIDGIRGRQTQEKCFHPSWMDSVLQTSAFQDLMNDTSSLWATDSVSLDRAERRIEHVKALVEEGRSTQNEHVQAIMTVLLGSLERLKQTNRAHLSGERDGDSDRYEHFLDGMNTPSPLSKDYGGYSDSLYLQLAKMYGNDAYGTGSALLNPATLFLLRDGFVFGFGEKPTWAPPYLKVEASTRGITFLQGHPVPKNIVLAAPEALIFRTTLAMLRLEFGGSVFKNPADYLSYSSFVTLRSALEIQISDNISLLPGVTENLPFYQKVGEFSLHAKNPKFGMSLLLGDIVGFRLDLPRKDFEEANEVMGYLRSLQFATSAQFGFDIYAISEGLRNGSSHQRRK